MKAITLWQPWATLCVLQMPCGWCDRSEAGSAARDAHRSSRHGVFKTIETRSWKAPAGLIGQRIAIHAAARTPFRLPVEAHPMCLSLQRTGGDRDLMLDGLLGGQAVPLPRGAVVGSAVLKACVPMIAYRDTDNGGREVNFGDGWVHPLDHGAPYREILDGPRLKIDLEPHSRVDVEGNVTVDAALELQGVDGPGWCMDVSDQAPFGDFRPGRFAWVLDKPIMFAEPVECRGYQRVWNLPDDLDWMASRGCLK